MKLSSLLLVFLTIDLAAANYERPSVPEPLVHVHAPRGGTSDGRRQIIVPPSSKRTGLVNIKDVVLALRWTGEMNRQLVHATSMAAPWFRDRSQELSPSSSSSQHHRSPYDTLRGGAGANLERSFATSSTSRGSSCYRIRSGEHTSSSNAHSSSLTIFHSMAPRMNVDSSSRGAARWGPDLTLFLEHILEVLGIQEESSRSLVFTLAMLYLDRASSVETPRSSGCVACPFLTPRTTHRLLLTSLVLAVQALTATTASSIKLGHPEGNNDSLLSLEMMYSRLESSLGIPVPQLKEMVTWMRGALGDPGIFVAPDQILEFQGLWESRFGVGKNALEDQEEKHQVQDGRLNSSRRHHKDRLVSRQPHVLSYKDEEPAVSEDEDHSHYYKVSTKQQYYQRAQHAVRMHS